MIIKNLSELANKPCPPGTVMFGSRIGHKGEIESFSD